MADRPTADAARLHDLIEAGVFVSSELSLDAVLERIVDSACRIVGARYGALGVIDESGTGLSTFIFKGLSEADRERIGNLPVGRGLLGALIATHEPVRLRDLSKDPRSVGFPEHHPAMTSFLGVPIRTRGVVFGNLYLTEKQDADEFTEVDERLAIVLAGQAGVAIQNARLYERARRNEEIATHRMAELELVQEIGSGLIEELDPRRILRMVVLHARKLVAADTALIALLDPSTSNLRIRVAAGDRAGDLEGMLIPVEGSIAGMTMASLGPRLVSDVRDDPHAYAPMLEAANARSAIFAPLVEKGQGIGVLAVAMHQAGGLGEDQLFVVKRFASLASLALQNATGVDARRERAAIEAELAESKVRDEMRAKMLRAVIQAQEDERRRISLELHDSFGQALASILLGLKVVAQEQTLEGARGRIGDLREVAATAATEVRRIAFELRPTALDDFGLRNALERYTSEVESRAGLSVPLEIELTSERLPPDVETIVYRIVQESLNNVVKHARAKVASVSLIELDGNVRLKIKDDGEGFETSSDRSQGLGILGMSERAALVNGEFTLESDLGGGTTVTVDLPGVRS